MRDANGRRRYPRPGSQYRYTVSLCRWPAIHVSRRRDAAREAGMTRAPQAGKKASTKSRKIQITQI